MEEYSVKNATYPPSWMNRFTSWVKGLPIPAWLFYAILIDLADAVAEELMLPFDRISLEMVFRGLYHFIQAYNRGETTDPVKYLAAPENRDLGVVKRLRNKKPDPISPETPQILEAVKL